MQKAGVLQDEYRYKIMCAYIDVEGYSSFESRVNDIEDDWDDDEWDNSDDDYCEAA